MKTIQGVLITSLALVFSDCKTNFAHQLFAEPTGSDPFYLYQWHLKNHGNTSGALAGEDAKVEPVWAQGIKGKGITATVNDDGMDLNHEDLRRNHSRVLTIDYTGQNKFYSTDKNCVEEDGDGYGCHGTSVAGVLGAVENNARGGKGVAPLVKIGARNILLVNDMVSYADAMSKNSSRISISNNSWGADDGTGKTDDYFGGLLWQAAVNSGIQTGRAWKGTLYFWAAGNGAVPVQEGGVDTPIHFDNSNQDSQANYYGTFAIAAIGNDGKKASYSEDGANLLVSAHSLGNTEVGITTTDVTGGGGYNIGKSSSDYTNTNYTNTFSGTSSSTPLAAGVGALVLEANPYLTMRDVRVLFARTARKNDPTDPGWIINGAGLHFNHKYGFGAVDASSAVTAARSWRSFGNIQVSATVNGGIGDGTSIPNNNTTGITNVAAFSSSSVTKVEFVELTLNVSSMTENPGDLLVELISPSGTKAILAVPHICSGEPFSLELLSLCNPYSNWRFGATTFIDESAHGNWSLRISDLCNYSGGITSCSTWGGYSINSTRLSVNNNAHTLNSWSLKIYGR
ncbi:S8 family serine peptidase [Leptospira ilyithenensis]|uniref:Serine protease n=1 Tax=Leptospira ilyithenensis TaxID=2484901 RepID=A0A4R9LPX0_9LEPT|nr:S8 family serine peptidase [Leptospira ilyithenensis]TGN11145.1 serine protease [Leptospira ilyithenensis]